MKLGYMKKGTARVEIEVLPIAGVDDRRDAVGGSYRYLQLGAFGAEDSAQQLRSKLQPLVSSEVVVSSVQSGEKLLYRVRLGPVSNGEELLQLQELLQANGYDNAQALP